LANAFLWAGSPTRGEFVDLEVDLDGHDVTFRPLRSSHRHGPGRLARRLHLVVARERDSFENRGVFPHLGSAIEIPAPSLAATQDQLVDGRAGLQHGPGVWFAEPLPEMTIFSEQYDFSISLLLLATFR
jgi:hypothetical protein